jgi:hypothetical protein
MMRNLMDLVVVGVLTVVLIGASKSLATIQLITGGPGASHVGNLVTNGSFELGAPASGVANQQYWATGTVNTPFAVPGGWQTAGPGPNYAVWGNDGTNPQRLVSADDIPDGNAALYMGNGSGATVNVPPTFNNDGSVTFPSAPSFTPKYGAPVRLTQTIPTHLNPALGYEMTFWVSGEGAHGALPGNGPGILEMAVSNVAAGNPSLFLSVPNGLGAQPFSRVYEFNFIPLNANLPVTVNFLNWGHFDLSAHGGVSFTTEAVIDDVIVNAIVPEPALGGFIVACLGISVLGSRRTGR